MSEWKMNESKRESMNEWQGMEEVKWMKAKINEQMNERKVKRKKRYLDE